MMIQGINRAAPAFFLLDLVGSGRAAAAKKRRFQLSHTASTMELVHWQIITRAVRIKNSPQANIFTSTVTSSLPKYSSFLKPKPLQSRRKYRRERFTTLSARTSLIHSRSTNIVSG